jgi:hypothetical protein
MQKVVPAGALAIWLASFMLGEIETPLQVEGTTFESVRDIDACAGPPSDNAARLHIKMPTRKQATVRCKESVFIETPPTWSSAPSRPAWIGHLCNRPATAPYPGKFDRHWGVLENPFRSAIR